MIKAFFKSHKKILLILYLVLLIYWLYFIFSNSLATGTESKAQSSRVVEISQKIVSTFDKDAVVNPSAVRTSAHFFEFFILGGLYFFGTYFFSKRSGLYLFISVGVSLFTALVDETLQLNVAGRGAEVTDIWVDFSGAVFAHAIIIFIIALTKLIKQK